jgi:EAL domain-containing protein (putative c-di-GMP-specific phosphodiesterase class I)
MGDGGVFRYYRSEYTQRQMDLLKAKGCDEIQGYYFSKPLAAERSL